MDELSIVFITLGINLGYTILHYCIRKISEYTEVDLFCISLKRDKNQSSIKNKSSSESDKDGITEISIK